MGSDKKRGLRIKCWWVLIVKIWIRKKSYKEYWEVVRKKRIYVKMKVGGESGKKYWYYKKD